VYRDDDLDEISARERVYGQATRSSEGRRSMAVVLFAVCMFTLIISLSCRQATEQSAATNVLEAGLVDLTDIDQLIADEGPALRQFALESQEDIITLPDYPLEVQVTREEVLQSSDEQLRAIVLRRSADLVYDEGIAAFDRTGEQSVRKFSIQGLLETGVNQLTAKNHSRATWFVLFSLAGCALFGVLLSATGEGWGRMRTLGMASAAAAIPCVISFFLLRMLVDQIGGDDPFIAAYGDIAHAVVGVPVRNGFVVLGVAVALVVGSVILGRLERTVSPQETPAFEDDW